MAGNLFGTLALGRMALQIDLSPERLDVTERLLRQECDRGSSEAAKLLAEIMRRDHGDEIGESLRLLVSSSLAGNFEAQLELQKHCLSKVCVCVDV